MSSLKDDAIEAARLLAAAHAASPSPALDAVHAHFRRGMYRHREALCLSREDVAEIDNAGAQLFGGTPKEPPEAP